MKFWRQYWLLIFSLTVFIFSGCRKCDNAINDKEEIELKNQSQPKLSATEIEIMLDDFLSENSIDSLSTDEENRNFYRGLIIEGKLRKVSDDTPKYRISSEW